MHRKWAKAILQRKSTGRELTRTLLKTLFTDRSVINNYEKDIIFMSPATRTKEAPLGVKGNRGTWQ